jgi:hypothetical protein
VTQRNRPPGASGWPKLPKEIQAAPDHRWQRGSEYEITTVAELVPKSYRQDGSLVAPPPEDTRSIQRTESGLDQLLRSGRISGHEVAAGKKFARDFEFGFYGASDPDRRLHLGRADDGASYSARDRFESARVDASTRWREASQAIGKKGTTLLTAFCVECLSIRAIAAREAMARFPDAPKADLSAESDAIRRDLAGAVVATLERLAEHYDDAERRNRRPRPATQPEGDDMTKLTAVDRAKPEYRAPHDREKARNLRHLEEQKARDAAKTAAAVGEL